MYEWRKMTAEQRRETLAFRRRFNLPWHGPSHCGSYRQYFMLTAACYEHTHIIGHSLQRMVMFEKELLETVSGHCLEILAWCVLSNHYHVLVRTEDIIAVLKDIGLMHGRLSHRWNGEEDRRGRKCWHRCVERIMRSKRHKWASLNYINNNPVHHRYVTKWQDWPFSSAGEYLEKTDPEIVRKMWFAYPIRDYGNGWDDPSL